MRRWNKGNSVTYSIPGRWANRLCWLEPNIDYSRKAIAVPESADGRIRGTAFSIWATPRNRIAWIQAGSWVSLFVRPCLHKMTIWTYFSSSKGNCSTGLISTRTFTRGYSLRSLLTFVSTPPIRSAPTLVLKSTCMETVLITCSIKISQYFKPTLSFGLSIHHYFNYSSMSSHVSL
jgi:hypothetical protein